LGRLGRNNWLSRIVKALFFFKAKNEEQYKGSARGQQEDRVDTEWPVAFVSIKAQQAGRQWVYGPRQTQLTLTDDGGEIEEIYFCPFCIHSRRSEIYKCPLTDTPIFLASNMVWVLTWWVCLSVKAVDKHR